MKIKIINDYETINNIEYKKIIKDNKKTIDDCVILCIKEENINSDNEIEIYIKYTDNLKIKEINNKYRQIDSPTDVLSFPMYEFDELREEKVINMIPVISLGDIIISVEMAEKQSKEYEHTFQRELIYLITHAMFHLLGYDHIDENDKKIMRAKEEKIMKILDIHR